MKRLERDELEKLLLDTLADLTMADHTGDMSNTMSEVFERMGIVTDDAYYWPDEMRRALHMLGAKTLCGIEVWSEEDELGADDDDRDDDEEEDE